MPATRGIKLFTRGIPETGSWSSDHDVCDKQHALAAILCCYGLRCTLSEHLVLGLICADMSDTNEVTLFIPVYF